MKRAFPFVTFFLLSSLLTACFRDTITEFENCVPEVTLVSTENTPTIEIIQAGSNYSDFETDPNDYNVCILNNNKCGAFVNRTFNFTSLPVGTEINFDGYVAEYKRIAVDTSLYLRGKIGEKTVWVRHRQAQNLADPANDDSLKKLGLIDETGKEVAYSSNWKCPNEG